MSLLRFLLLPCDGLALDHGHEAEPALPWYIKRLAHRKRLDLALLSSTISTFSLGQRAHSLILSWLHSLGTLKFGMVSAIAAAQRRCLN
jgi:hypothetical protein